jgi:hypothetical protein
MTDWLACKEVPLVPFPSDRMTAQQINTYINNVKNQGPQCVEPTDPSAQPPKVAGPTGNAPPGGKRPASSPRRGRS